MKDRLNQKETKNLINYWTEGAEEDFKTAKILFDSKIYHYSLYFCHLTLEKLLKALVIRKTKSHALPIHNLLKLASDAKLQLTSNQIKELSLINEFNIRARYNDYKREFYKKATLEYTQNWLKVCEVFYILIKKELKKN